MTYAEEVQFFGENIERILVSFLNKNFIVNQYGFILINHQASVPVSFPQESSYRCGVDILWPFTFWFIVVLLVCNIWGFLHFGHTMWHSWGVILVYQVVAYLPYLNTYKPSCLSFFCKHLGFANLDFNWFMRSHDITETGFPYRWTRQGLIYSNFLYNSHVMIFVWILAILMILFFFLLWLCCYKRKKWRPYLSELERVYRYHAFFKGIILCYLKLGFTGVIQIIYPNFTGGSGALSMIFAFAAVGGLGSAFVWILSQLF